MNDEIYPEDHVEAPDMSILTRPDNPAFFHELKNAFAWVRYIWMGPKPIVKVDLFNVYGHQQFSPQSIYSAIIEVVSSLKLPGVKVRPEIIHEGGRFSPYRAYLQIRREFSEFLVCAAPAGASFFVSVRKIDRFRHVKWFHYLFAFGAIAFVVASGQLAFGFLGGIAVAALLLSFLWSLMRYASEATMSWLGERLPEIPFIGGLYLRWFRPDTYFRQDLHGVFMTLVDRAVREVIAGLNATQPERPSTEELGGPIQKDLNRFE